MDKENLYNLILNPSIDIRSPKEFKKGTIPNSINIPILNDDEYHQVGSVYKSNGKQSAIDIGHKIVSGKTKQIRIESWIKYIQNNHNCFIFCYRGGLRSKIAFDWITHRGVSVKRLEDGYKRYRQQIVRLHDRIDNYKGRWIILGGYTGSGKTKFLENFKESVNLESIANHRGSAFGKTGTSQPSQSNFESIITEEYLKRYRSKILLMEDESRLIGRTKLPGRWYDKMQISDIVLLEADIEQRSKNIYDDYVRYPISTKNNVMELWSYYLNALNKIKKRLGDDHYKKINSLLNEAFKNSDEILHLKWIKKLLEKYYDRMYRYKLNLRSEHVIFKGNLKDCKNFISALTKDNK